MRNSQKSEVINTLESIVGDSQDKQGSVWYGKMTRYGTVSDMTSSTPRPVDG